MFRKGFTITRGSIITDTTLLISRNACQTPTPGEVVLVGLFFDLPVLSPSPSVATTPRSKLSLFTPSCLSLVLFRIRDERCDAS